jgi:hypothetical protein
VVSITGSNPVLTTKIKIMKEKLLKDLPIYLNGFAVGMLFFSISNIQVIDVCMFILAGVTFFWYGKTKTT